MKKTIAALLMLAALGAHAEEVRMATTADGTGVWYAYTETADSNQDAFAVMMSFRARGKKTGYRYFQGVVTTDCRRGFGHLYSKEKASGEWAAGEAWTSSGTTVADRLGRDLCSIQLSRLGEDTKTTY